MQAAHASPRIVLSYFPCRGRAEPLRLLLADSGLAWENELLSQETWPAAKPKTLLGTCPALRWLDDGSAGTGNEVRVAQCVGIAHFLATKLARRKLLGTPGNDGHLAGFRSCVKDRYFIPAKRHGLYPASQPP